ncbi:MAG: AMIN domain-containing protein [Drouetiella hepatica Uher 2000/2452]|uniref:AMIN domain-containing protein n=1 Tax=Drouetiella hepatica Uher 2000/2452 TaxID=904376 RepID=A0A951QB57_9CYAN|nr:AMIN domain-containing protein [Drouetiella hepatica Uher 2000/2452]
MERHLGIGGFIGGVAILAIAAQPAGAAATQITNVQVASSEGKVNVTLQTGAGDRPQVFTVKRGNALVADIVNAQLKLPQGSFSQDNPAPGISSVTVAQLDTNSVRVTVSGGSDAPSAQVNRGGSGIVLSVSPSGAIAQAQPQTEPSQAAPDEAPAETPAEIPAETPAPVIPQAPGNILIPNPGVTIDGVPVLSPTNTYIPPIQSRAVPPPLGDIAFSNVDVSTPTIDLGSNEVVPRLVLRDAPARDVLSLLARAAGLNIAYIDGNGDPTSTPPIPGAEASTDGAAGVKVSLDIENEPVASVFNYVLRITGLEANRSGRTIFVGPRLPNSARQVISRTLRLNQVPVQSAVSFLVGLGAETAVSSERLVTTVTATPITTDEGIVAQDASGQAAQARQTQQSTESTINVQRVDFQDSTPILRGLQVVGDARTNAVTLIGNPKAVEVAISQLAQLDIRRRQVAINVRVIDVNLLGTDRASTSFSFGIGNNRVASGNGVGVVNFGDSTPANTGLDAGSIGSAVLGGVAQPGNFEFVNKFLAQLQIAVTTGNAKILTDPTLVVQEGQQAEVQLTQDVVTNLEVETEGTGDERTQTVTVERTPAGLILQVQVDRIDDNGFVALSVAPAISSPATTQTINIQGVDQVITLLAIRRVSSGQIRVRDGQTLILSGIIQDSDRAEVTKIPILGDIPLLGALFRRTARTNTRQEVIVVLTPQILDDSDNSSFGYRYTPSSEAQQLLQRPR